MRWTALLAKETYKIQLLSIPGVVGVGVSPARLGLGEKVNIYVRRLTKELAEALPKEIMGVPVNVMEVGLIEAFENTGKMRPAKPGVSIGNIEITAGTFGAVVVDNETGKRGILSNAHVLTSNPSEILINRDVVQPGPSDGGAMEDKIGETKKWVVLNANRTNLVDCAFAEPISQEDISDEIIGIGPVLGVENALVDMNVIKSGRTSEITEGQVIDVNAAVVVGYSDSSFFIFDDQIITGLKENVNMGKPGDSGSLLLNSDNHFAVGLLFAGSDVVTAHNKISNVMNSLNVSFPSLVPPPTPQSLLQKLVFPLGFGLPGIMVAVGEK